MAVSFIKERLSPNSRQHLRRAWRRILRSKEFVIGGGEPREVLLLKLLGTYYRRQYHRQWELGDEEPHFFSQRIGFYEFAFGDGGHGPYPFYRGFFASEVLRDNDTLLDIGCGDGFFTKRFLSEPCAHIDAIDVESDAIRTARKQNSAANITYHLLDAVNDPFPRSRYDVIVWDGALGHFAPSTTCNMLQKIKTALDVKGVFAGSESLGVEGSDHLQFFHTLDDLYALLKPYFNHIELREESYPIGIGSKSLLRREGYWRCANDSKRLGECRWKVYRNADHIDG